MAAVTGWIVAGVLAALGWFLIYILKGIDPTGGFR